MSTKPLSKKIYYALLGASVFFIISHPHVYGIVDKLPFIGQVQVWDEAKNCPTLTGHFIHTAAFFLVMYLLLAVLNYFKPTSEQKSTGLLIKYSFFSTLMFFLLSNDNTYRFVDNLSSGFGLNIANDGCPTELGISVHTIVFFLIKFALMHLPKE